MDRSFEDLSEEDKNLILYGSDGKEFHFHYENEFGGVRDIDIPFEGIVNNIKTSLSRDKQRLHTHPDASLHE